MKVDIDKPLFSNWPLF